MDGDLGAETGFAGDALDLDRAVGDFGDFQLEELLDEVGIGAREGQLRALGLGVEVQQQEADAVADLVFLARDAFLAGHDALGVAEVDEHVAAVEAPDGAGHDVAHVVLVDAVDLVLFGHAQLLDDGLLGRLGGNAPEIARGDFDFDQVAELEILARELGLSVVEGHFLVAVADEIHDLDAREGLDLQRLAIDRDAQIPHAPDAFASGHLQGGLDQLGERFAVQLALPLHVFKYSQQFVVHISNLLPMRGKSATIRQLPICKRVGETHSHRTARVVSTRGKLDDPPLSVNLQIWAN